MAYAWLCGWLCAGATGWGGNNCVNQLCVRWEFVGENFSKTLNCYLLIKYWFKMTSFLGVTTTSFQPHSYRRRTPCGSRGSRRDLIFVQNEKKKTEKMIWRPTAMAINRSLSFILVQSEFECRVWSVVCSFTWTKRNTTNGNEYILFVCFRWHTSPVISYAWCTCAHTAQSALRTAHTSKSIVATPPPVRSSEHFPNIVTANRHTKAKHVNSNSGTRCWTLWAKQWAFPYKMRLTQASAQSVLHRWGTRRAHT